MRLWATIYKVIMRHHKNRYTNSLEYALKAAEEFFNLMNLDKDTNWRLPGINATTLQLRLASYMADKEGKTGENTQILRAEATLKRYFQKMVIDRSPLQSTKKMGCLFIIVHLLKIYFKLNNLRLCTNLLKAVDSDNFPSLDSFPPSQTVAYQFYLGRLSIFEERYDKAETSLDSAFLHCHQKSRRNKRRILQYLIPVKLLLGKFPDVKLLEKYNLLQFKDLVDSVKRGHLKLFNDSLETHQEFFIRKGIFLMLEKLKTTIYRNLFLRAYKFYQTETDDPAIKKNHLPLKVLQAALRINGIEMDTDELECILANLIYQGFMKGYIAHKRVVVMSKTEPFPVLTSSSISDTKDDPNNPIIL